MKVLSLSGLAMTLCLSASVAVAAQPPCGSRDNIVKQLKAKFNESHRASGLESDTKMVEIWTSKQSGSWTILVTRASGVTCIAAAGKSWLDLPEETPVKGTAS